MSIQAISPVHANGFIKNSENVQSSPGLSIISKISAVFFSCISLSFISNLLRGNWISQERLYKMAYTGLIAASCVGALGSLVLWIQGAPAVAGLLGGLSLCSATGAYMADQMAKQRGLSQCVDEMKKTNEDLCNETSKFSHENKKLKGHNRNLKSNVQQVSTENQKLKTNVLWMTDENEKLTANIQQMSGEIVSLHENVVKHRKCRRKLKREVEQLQANLRLQRDQNGKFEAQNCRYRDLVNECSLCIKELRDQNVIQDENFLQRLYQLDGNIGVSVGLWDQI